MRKVIPVESIAAPQANPLLFPGGVAVRESNNTFFTRFCMWASENGFDTPEFLLPQIQINNKIEPFLFERRFASSGMKPPSPEVVASHATWAYQVEWGNLSTLGERRDDDWRFHRHRASLFPDLAADLVGSDISALSVMDVACHCGIMALEFAERGFKHVLGLELREHSVRQANFLKESFGIENADFKVDNARNLSRYNADIVFCGGLLYHVTFPVELVTDLFNAAGKFLIFDSLCQNHPFSGFHIVSDRDVNRSLDGDNAVELIPTYRSIIDLMRAVGFVEIYEILGSQAESVPFYKTRNVRSFLAVKPGVKLKNLTC